MADKLFMSCCQMYRISQLDQKQEKKSSIFSSYNYIGTSVLALVKNISDTNVVFFWKRLYPGKYWNRNNYSLVWAYCGSILFNGSTYKPCHCSSFIYSVCLKKRKYIIHSRRYQGFQVIFILRNMAVLDSLF